MECENNDLLNSPDIHHIGIDGHAIVVKIEEGDNEEFIVSIYNSAPESFEFHERGTGKSSRKCKTKARFKTTKTAHRTSKEALLLEIKGMKSIKDLYSIENFEFITDTENTIKQESFQKIGNCPIKSLVALMVQELDTLEGLEFRQKQFEYTRERLKKAALKLESYIPTSSDDSNRILTNLKDALYDGVRQAEKNKKKTSKNI